MKQRISTVVNELLTPILIKYAGRKWTPEFARAVQKDIYQKTGKYVGFREVSLIALSNAVDDLNSHKTFSFNIVPTSTLVDEYNLASEARRERFDGIYNPHPLLQDKKAVKNRFQISIPNIRSKKQYDVQVIISENGDVWPVGVVGYYGSNMNSWAKRVGLRMTQGAHSKPSTHYMDAQKAGQYVFFIKEIVSRFQIG